MGIVEKEIKVEGAGSFEDQNFQVTPNTSGWFIVHSCTLPGDSGGKKSQRPSMLYMRR